MKVIIAAAGTAGHINPGLAIANKIKKEEKNSEIMFIGTTRGLENDLVPRAGYKLKTIDAYGLSKKISIENIKKMIKTLQGYGEAKKIIKEFKPDIVIGTGGYICGATISAAHNLKIPTMLHESNAFPGKAIKMLARKTDTILVSFKDAIPRIKNAKNVILEVAKDFEKMTGRKYGLFEEYKLDDAEIAIVCMNSTAGTTKFVVDNLRKNGIKAGLLKIRVFRPFPAEEIANALSNLKAVAVLDKADSLNGAGGALFEDVTSAMYVNNNNVPTVNYIYGIGGRDTKTNDIEKVYTDLLDIAKSGKAENPYRYLGLRKEEK